MCKGEQHQNVLNIEKADCSLFKFNSLPSQYSLIYVILPIVPFEKKHSYRKVIIAGERVQIISVCSILNSFKQLGILIVSYLILFETSVYRIVPFTSQIKPGVLSTNSNPDSRGISNPLQLTANRRYM